MDLSILDSLASYATPPNNYIGTTLFLSYIVLALYATLSITYSLYTQYNTIYHSASPNKDANIIAAKAARARHIKIYAFLASLSFATLSYHMLFFLVTHYQAWSGEISLASISGDKLVRWMLESSLFQDFANELVENAQNATWTQLAILATWSWNIWMARKGTCYISHRLKGFTIELIIVNTTCSTHKESRRVHDAQLHPAQPNPPHQLHSHSFPNSMPPLKPRYSANAGKRVGKTTAQITNRITPSAQYPAQRIITRAPFSASAPNLQRTGAI